MRLALLFLGAASLMSAAVTGVVVNKTTGKPQAGVTVTMTKIGANGMEPAGSTKSGADGKFSFDGEAGTAHLLQAEYQGVRYSAPMAQAAANEVEITVYDASTRVPEAKAEQHMIMVESNGQELVVNETVVFSNPSQTTWADTKGGTVKVFVPAAAGTNIMARVIAPGSMPVERQPLKTNAANVWTVDYPVKPGETRFDFSYKLPASAGGVLDTKLLNGTAAPKLVLPQGIKADGESITSLGSEPNSNASIFDITAKAIKLTISGSGTLAVTSPAEEESEGPKIKQIAPPGYERNWKLTLALTLAFLALGFAAHYLKGTTPAISKRKV